MPARVYGGALVLLVAAAMAVGGCGDDSPGESQGEQGYETRFSTTMRAADPPLTKAEFIGRANEICRIAWREVFEYWTGFVDANKTKRSWRKKTPKEKFADIVHFPVLTSLNFYIFNMIRKLGAPAGEEAEIEAIVGPLQVGVELGWDNRWHAYSIAELVSRFATYSERARRYGLDDCPVNARHLASLRGVEP